MNTRVTDIALLSSFGIAAIQDSMGLLFTVVGGVFVGIIRWQQHRQTLRNMKLDEELKQAELKRLQEQISINEE